MLLVKRHLQKPCNLSPYKRERFLKNKKTGFYSGFFKSNLFAISRQIESLPPHHRQSRILKLHSALPTRPIINSFYKQYNKIHITLNLSQKNNGVIRTISHYKKKSTFLNVKSSTLLLIGDPYSVLFE